VGNVIADYQVKIGVTISQTSVCKLSFNSGKLRIKRNTHADLSRHYATESQHKHWDKIAENRNRIPVLPREREVANFRLITRNDCQFIQPQSVSCAKKITRTV
jgi:hypothetical protein